MTRPIAIWMSRLVVNTRTAVLSVPAQSRPDAIPATARATTTTAATRTTHRRYEWITSSAVYISTEHTAHRPIVVTCAGSSGRGERRTPRWSHSVRRLATALARYGG